MADYKRAEEAFAAARRLDAASADGMSTYSTVLWHVKKEATLAGLAHMLVEANPQSAETWCVVGNCFALQNEHEKAIKFFERVRYVTCCN